MRQDRIAALLAAGDHRAARQAAGAVLADAAASGEDRVSAAAALASLAPERSAVVAGCVAVALAVAVALWTVLGGGR